MGGGYSAGGSQRLAGLIDQFGEFILADFHSYYGLSLPEVMGSGGYSPRAILALIKQLPPEARTVAALRGGEQFQGWGVDRYLLASLIDAVQQNTYAFISANSKRKPKAPEPVSRPTKDGGPRQDNANNPFRQRLAAAKQAKQKG